MERDWQVDKTNIERIMYKQIKLLVCRNIGDVVGKVSGEYLEKIINTETRDMILQLESKVYARETKITKEKLQVPASWWQHVKKDCFPTWLKKMLKTEIRYNTIDKTVTLYQYAPEIELKAEDFYSGDFYGIRPKRRIKGG